MDGVTAAEKRLLGELLLARGVVDEAGLAVALAEQERTGRLLGELVVALGLTSSGEVSRALIEQAILTKSALQAATQAAVADITNRLAPSDQLAPVTLETLTVPDDSSEHPIHTGILALLLLRHLRAT